VGIGTTTNHVNSAYKQKEQAMKVEIIKTDAKFQEKLQELRVTGKAIDLLIHRLAVSALFHYGKAWNWTKVKEVIDAMPKSSRRKALVLWVQANASLMYKAKTDSLVQPKEVEKRFVELDEAMAVPFWDLSEENPDKPVMTMEQLLKFITQRAKKATVDGALGDLDLKRLHKVVTEAFDKGVEEGKAEIPADPAPEEVPAEPTLQDVVGG
jgi:ATP-dependent protease HslVU (ClpYQ) ATPase subunit